MIGGFGSGDHTLELGTLVGMPTRDCFRIDIIFGYDDVILLSVVKDQAPLGVGGKLFLPVRGYTDVNGSVLHGDHLGKFYV